MRGIAVLAAALAIAAAAPTLASANHPPRPQTVLRLGSHGTKVESLQWLLGGHKPGVFTHRTLAGKPSGLFGERTAAAVTALKWWLGYPRKWVKPIAGPYLFRVLLGQTQRPPGWIALAARRLKETAPGATRIAIRIKTIELAQLGVAEHPLGSNWGTISNGLHGGATVLAYQSVTHAIGAAWCVSFQQWSFWTSGYGTFAADTASVYSAVDYASGRGWLHPQAKIGALVAFISYDGRGNRIPGTGHMGYVTAVTAHGFVSIEGNASNRVLEQFHTIGDRGAVFIWLPGLTVPAGRPDRPTIPNLFRPARR